MSMHSFDFYITTHLYEVKKMQMLIYSKVFVMCWSSILSIQNMSKKARERQALEMVYLIDLICHVCPFLC